MAKLGPAAGRGSVGQETGLRPRAAAPTSCLVDISALGVRWGQIQGVSEYLDTLPYNYNELPAGLILLPGTGDGRNKELSPSFFRDNL